MIQLYYFEPDEFIRGDINWFPAMSPRLLVLLDTFRHLTGKCIISPHPKAIGRRTEIIDGYYDAHNFDKWDEVRGIDVFPYLPDESIYDEPHGWIDTAKGIGFTGIGLYPHWTYKGKQRPGLHLDVRHNREPGNPSKWGRIGQEYVSLDKAMEELA